MQKCFTFSSQCPLHCPFFISSKPVFVITAKSTVTFNTVRDYHNFSITFSIITNCCKCVMLTFALWGSKKKISTLALTFVYITTEADRQAETQKHNEKEEEEEEGTLPDN